MSIIVFDLEANGLNELVLDRKGNPSTEADKIHVLITKDIKTGIVSEFVGDDISIGYDLLKNADAIVGHNIILYDLRILERLLGVCTTKAIDTLIVSRMMYPDKGNHPLKGNSLKLWGEHLGITKSEYTLGWEDVNDEMIAYCKQDVEVSEAIYKAQIPFMKQYPKSVKLEHLVTEIIAGQIDNGFTFDLDQALDLEKDLMIEKACIEDEMRTIFPDIMHIRYSEKTGKRLKDKIEVFNPGSRKQIGERLVNKYKWKPPLTDKGNYHIDSDVLSSLDFPEAKKLCTYFDTTKLMSQVSDWVIRASSSRDGKIHGSINPQGTVTGRMTASQPNLQQVSGDPRARALFKPRDGWVQVGIDASGLEARMLANRMAPYDNLEYGIIILTSDIHEVNRKAAGLSTRDQAKTFFYGLIYGAGNVKIGEIIGKGVGAGASLKKRFLSNLPAIKKVLDNCAFQVADKKTITLLDGREVPCRSKHVGLNVQLQGDGAIIMKLALCLLVEKLKAYTGQWGLMATVHDEWQFEAHPDIAERLGIAGCAAIKEAGERLGCTMTLDGKYSIGSNWSECH